MKYWNGYLPGARCRVFAYGPADAIAVQNPHHFCLVGMQNGFVYLVLAFQGSHGKEAIKRMFCFAVQI